MKYTRPNCIDPDLMIQYIGQAEGDLLDNRINEVSHSASSLSHFIFFPLCLSCFHLFLSLSVCAHY